MSEDAQKFKMRLRVKLLKLHSELEMLKMRLGVNLMEMLRIFLELEDYRC